MINKTRFLFQLVGLGLLAANTVRAAAIDGYVWDLSSLYREDGAWEAERTAVSGRLPKLQRFAGRVANDPGSLADALDEFCDLRARASKMAIYAILRDNLDKNSPTAAAQNEAAPKLEAQVEAAGRFVRAEIQRAPAEKIRQWLKEEPRLERHRLTVNRILREAPHAVEPAAEIALESMTRLSQTTGDLFWALHDSDLAWPVMPNSKGENAPVNLYAFRAAKPELKLPAARALFSHLRKFESAFGLLYTRRIEADLAAARHRQFDSGIEAIFSSRDAMPPGSYRVAIEVARKNGATLRRYAALRNRALGLKKFTYGDIQVPPPAITRSFDVESAIHVALKASEPLGDAYQQRLRERLGQKWMHLPPLASKRGEFGVYWRVAGAHPYLVMSYRDDYNSSRTLCGGLALMMSYGDVPENRAAETRDDPAIYSNAIIYFGNMLHDDFLRSQAKSRDERIALLVQSLDTLRSQYFRWSILSELDLQTEDLIKAGKNPTGAEISKAYLKLLREYYGAADDAFAGEWMTFPVPFASYEHQFWPPAMAAAAVMTEKLRAGDATVRRAVTEVLRRGESDRSFDLFRDAGIDMSTPEPYLAVISRMNRLLDELEKELAPNR